MNCIATTLTGANCQRNAVIGELCTQHAQRFQQTPHMPCRKCGVEFPTSLLERHINLRHDDPDSLDSINEEEYSDDVVDDDVEMRDFIDYDDVILKPSRYVSDEVSTEDLWAQIQAVETKHETNKPISHNCYVSDEISTEDLWAQIQAAEAECAAAKKAFEEAVQKRSQVIAKALYGTFAHLTGKANGSNKPTDFDESILTRIATMTI